VPRLDARLRVIVQQPPAHDLRLLVAEKAVFA
jgi:hypothetical protein